MTSGLNEIPKHIGTEVKARKRLICSNVRSKPKNQRTGNSKNNYTRRGSEIARGEGTQQKEKRNITTGEMNGNKWRVKPAQNKARKNLQL